MPAIYGYDNWGVTGIYTKEKDAQEACANKKYYFVAPVVLNNNLGTKLGWKEAYYFDGKKKVKM